MSLLCTLQGRRKNRWIQEQFHKALLVLDRQANHVSFVDCPVCDLLSSGDHKIADTAALQFRGTLDDPERIGRDASFDTCCAGRLPGHAGKLSALYGISPHKSNLPRLSQRGHVAISGAGCWTPYRTYFRDWRVTGVILSARLHVSHKWTF
jgi:hypothetical protein